ncbi:MAG: serine/threonine-protein kinase, partial [Acidobacteriota bacterium]
MKPDDPAPWDRIEALFHRAVDLPEAGRRALLSDQAPAVGDAVRRLLRGADHATGFLETSASSPPGPSLSAGDAVGPWRIEEWLGAGGMGEVYRVSRTEGDFHQTAALKRMRGAPTAGTARFVRERQLLARLEHPHIARLIDGGSASGHEFMVVELVEGDALHDDCAARDLPEHARLALFLQLCSAVAHAHSRLVLHRDIKPRNVLVTAAGDVKLIDFGVAHSLDDVEEDRGAPLTLAYAAPEQLAGGPISAATDLYAMGLLLHEVLTGRRLERGAAVDPGLSADLRAILARALERDPARRYASADGFAEDLRRYLARRPVAARGGGRAYRLGRFLARYRAASIALGLLALLVVLGLVLPSQYSISRTTTIAASPSEVHAFVG